MAYLKDKSISWLIKWLMVDASPREFSLSDFERIKYELRPGDVILIEGRNRVSEVIKVITQSPWSHAALYMGRLHDVEDVALRKHIEQNYHGNPESQMVIESYLGKGTIVSPIEHYKSDHIRICRPKGLSRQDAQRVINYAICRLGIDYDVRQILDLARYFFPWGIMPRSWRSSLFKRHPGRATKQICSTLIAEAFATVNFPVLPLVKKDEEGLRFIRRNPRLCVPSDFDYSPYFEIIKYPLFELTGQTIYRNLPWSADTIMSNDEQGIVIADKDSDLPMMTEAEAEKIIRDTTTKIFIEESDSEQENEVDGSTSETPETPAPPEPPETTVENISEPIIIIEEESSPQQELNLEADDDKTSDENTEEAKSESGPKPSSATDSNQNGYYPEKHIADLAKPKSQTNDKS